MAGQSSVLDQIDRQIVGELAKDALERKGA